MFYSAFAFLLFLLFRDHYEITQTVLFALQSALKHLIKRVSESVTAICRSTTCESFYLEQCKKDGLPANRLLRDNDASWTSKFIMLSRVVRQWSAFDATCRSKAGIKSKLSLFNDAEKTMISCFLQLLKPLKLATERLEAEKVPSISTALVLLQWLQKKFASDPTPSSSIQIFPHAVSMVRQSMSRVLCEQLQHYLSSRDVWITSALDPRVSTFKITRFNCLSHLTAMLKYF